MQLTTLPALHRFLNCFGIITNAKAGDYYIPKWPLFRAGNMVYTNTMDQDGNTPTTQSSEQTVFQQPTSGFMTDDVPVVASQSPEPTRVDTPKTDQPKPFQVEPTSKPEPQTQPQPQEQQAQSDSRSSQQTQPSEDEYYDEYDYSGYFPDIPKPMPEQLLYEWQAQSRPFKKHNRNYYTTIAVIVLLISLILIFSGQFLPMAVVCAVAFLAYVINSVPPQDIMYQITTYGIRIGDRLYYWELMRRFWYGSKYDQELLYIDIVEFPDRLTLVLGQAEKDIISAVLSEVLLLEKPPLTVYERIAQWLQEKFPLDLDS